MWLTSNTLITTRFGVPGSNVGVEFFFSAIRDTDYRERLMAWSSTVRCDSTRELKSELCSIEGASYTARGRGEKILLSYCDSGFDIRLPTGREKEKEKCEDNKMI